MTFAYGTYLGRVGALAVALGVSGAVATTPGVAWADESPSHASSGPAVSESGAPSAPASDGSAGTGVASAPVPHAADAPEAGTDDSDASSPSAQTSDDGDRDAAGEDAGAADDDGAAASPERKQPSTDDDVTPRARSRTQRGTPPVAPSSVRVESDSDTDQVTSQAVATSLPAPSPDTPARPATLPTSRTVDVSGSPSPGPTPAAPSPAPHDVPGAVISVAANLVSAVLAPFFAPDPSVPPDSPLLWTVLAWARRQFTSLTAGLMPASNVVQTTEIEPAAAELAKAAVVVDPQVTAVAAQGGLPPDFERTSLASGLVEPTDFEFLPDGRILILEKGGAIRVFHDGELHDEPLMTLSVDSQGERGLLGIAVDPDFANNGYIYVSYNPLPYRDQLSRFTVNGDTVVPGSELVLLKSDLAGNLIHHGGEVDFGPDGKLYWGVGENSYAPNAQDLSNIHGKILRINPDGTVPADNPFVNTPGALGQVYAYGLRNPFRFTFTPNGKLLVGDVGSGSWEEVNVITPGADYGWPLAEGACQGCAFVNPIYAYPHAEPLGSGAITSVLAYTDDEFGEAYRNKVFIADYTQGWIKVLTFDSEYSSFISEQMFDDQAGSTVKLVQGPDGAIYQLTIYPGELFRIAPSGGNRAPTAVITASPTNGLAPLPVSLSAASSSDPDPGTTLTYSWDFGDGTSSTAVTASKTYSANGTYIVTLTVSDGEKTGHATQTITVGSTAPTVEILTPADGLLYSAGDTISFSGTGSDAEDGTLPASAYVWRVDFHHAEHVHPFSGDIVGSSGSVVIPRGPQNEADTWYRINLTVTDSSGLSTTTFVDVKPRLVDLTFDASHPGVTYTVDGIPHVGSVTETTVVGVEHVVSVVTPQNVGDQNLVFNYWSDVGQATHTIIAPSTETTYTVTFAQLEPSHANSLQILGQVIANNVATGQLLWDGLGTSAGALEGLPAALVTAIGGVVANPLNIPADAIQLVTDVAEIAYGAAVPVLNAINEIIAIEATRDARTLDSLGSNIGPLIMSLLNAPIAIGAVASDAAIAVWQYIATLDPGGVLARLQLAQVEIPRELGNRWAIIFDAGGDLVDGVLAAVTYPPPPGAALAFQA